jgi:hypothetical protein
VRNILKNSRYRGLWKYGVCESVFLPEADYVRQRPRVEPLAQTQIDELRIIDDDLWYAAQERLATERGNGGRPPADGNHASRPKLLNGLMVCPQHDDQVLYVSGPHGNMMTCPLCRAMPAAERPLYSILNRKLATELIIAKLVELLAGDPALIEQSIAICQAAAESAQLPDPQALGRVRQDIAQLDRAIMLTRRTVGDTVEEQAQAEQSILDMQREAAGLRASLARLEAAQSRAPRIPTKEEVSAIFGEASARLMAAVETDEPEVIAHARRILELLTDGRITMHQQGQRKAQKGWLQGRFWMRLLPYLLEQCGGYDQSGDGAEITIDFRRPSSFDAESDEAWRLRQQGMKHLDIAHSLKIGKSKVTKLLKLAAAKRGVPYEDGRSRRCHWTQ